MTPDPHDDATTHAGRPRRRRWGRRVAAGLAVLLVLGVVVGEVVARWVLGLGDPPLVQADPEIEYLMKPGDYRRFGHHIAINRFHMRAPERDAFEVMIFGDSGGNGGSLTDQSQLATSLLAEALGVSVGNASAGSWGPPNLLAYAERFGVFDARVVVVVVSSPDASDVPTFQPVSTLGPSFPTRRPPSALIEGITRYLPRFLASRARPTGGDAPTAPAVLRGSERPADPVAIDALEGLVRLIRDVGAEPLLALHLERDETAGEAPGHRAWLALAESMDVPVVVLGLDASCYRDRIHPNAEGQRRIARALEAPVRTLLLGEKDAAPPSP